MKRRLVLYIGLSLLVGLYLYDRDNSTEALIAATVVSIEDRSAEAGPDTWHITVQMDGATVELEPRQARPDLSLDDRVCVTVISRKSSADQHFLAPQSADC